LQVISYCYNHGLIKPLKISYIQIIPSISNRVPITAEAGKLHENLVWIDFGLTMLIVKVSQIKTGAAEAKADKKFQVKKRQNLILNQENKELMLIQPGLIHSGEGRRFAIPGGICTIKATGEDTGGTYAMIEMSISPQGGPPPHIHSREIESFYILEGSLSFWLSDRKLSGSAGSSHSSARAHPHL
jgi:quercetin dioxygenase-like cupin family protein